MTDKDAIRDETEAYGEAVGTESGWDRRFCTELDCIVALHDLMKELAADAPLRFAVQHALTLSGSELAARTALLNAAHATISHRDEDEREWELR